MKDEDFIKHSLGNSPPLLLHFTGHKYHRDNPDLKKGKVRLLSLMGLKQGHIPKEDVG